MQINIYKDQMERGSLFGKPVLFTMQDIPRETVPDGWHCYDLCGNDRNPDKPTEMMDRVFWERLGTVLSPVPLKREATEVRKIKDTLVLSGEMTGLNGFCQEHGLTCPSDPRKFILRPASRQEGGCADGRHNPRAGSAGNVSGVDRGPAGYIHGRFPWQRDVDGL